MNTGHGVPLICNSAMRKRIGLPELPPTTHSFLTFKEVQNICKMWFDELIGYDESTGGLKE